MTRPSFSGASLLSVLLLSTLSARSSATDGARSLGFALGRSPERPAASSRDPSFPYRDGGDGDDTLDDDPYYRSLSEAREGPDPFYVPPHRRLQVPDDSWPTSRPPDAGGGANKTYNYTDWFDGTPSGSPRPMQSIIRSKIQLLWRYHAMSDRMAPPEKIQLVREGCDVCDEDAKEPLRNFIKSMNIKASDVPAQFPVCELPFMVCIRVDRRGERGPEHLLTDLPDLVEGYFVIIDPVYQTQLKFPPGGSPLNDSLYELKGLLGVVLMNAPIEGTLSEKIGNLEASCSEPSSGERNCTGGLRVLYIDRCPHISGPLPNNITSLKLLRGIYIDETPINGTLPPSFHELFTTSLESLSLIKTNLDFTMQSLFNHGPTGPAPCRTLRVLRLAGENITGRLTGSFDHCQELEEVDIRNSGVEGPLPALKLQKNLTVFRLQECRDIRGPIPPFYGTNTKLEEFEIVGSPNITGPIPDSFNNLKSLRELIFRRTNLSELPATLEALQNLTTLELESNNFTGLIPAWISKLDGLHTLRLGRNNFTGWEGGTWEIPPALVHLDASNNKLPRIPPNWRRIKTVRRLFLSCNHIKSIGSGWGIHDPGLHTRLTSPSPSARIVAQILKNPPPYWPTIRYLSLRGNQINVTADEFLMPWKYNDYIHAIFGESNGLHGALTPDGVNAIDMDEVLRTGLLDTPPFRRFKKSFMAAYGLTENATNMSMVDPNPSDEPVVDDFDPDEHVVDVETLNDVVTLDDVMKNLTLNTSLGVKKGFEQLQLLNLKNNSIQEIREGVDVIPTSLVFLNLANNSLTSIDMTVQPMQRRWDARHNWIKMYRANFTLNPDLRMEEIQEHDNKTCEEHEQLFLEAGWDGEAHLTADINGYRPYEENNITGVECTKICPYLQQIDLDVTVKEEVLCRCQDGYEGKGLDCTECPQGQVTIREKGWVDCQECPEGSVATNNGTACECATGWVYDLKDKKCRECPAGTYKDTEGNDASCKKCPKHFTSLRATTKGEDCFCDKGFYLKRADNQCHPLPKGVREEDAPCGPDYADDSTHGYHAAFMVNEGYFELETKVNLTVPLLPIKDVKCIGAVGPSATVRAVLEGGNQPLELGHLAMVRGINLSAIYETAGEPTAPNRSLELLLTISTYDAYVTSSPVLVECPIPEACEGSVRHNNTMVEKLNKCKEGHEGHLCGSCKRGWRSVGTSLGLCRKCNNKALNVLLSIFLYVLILAVIFAATVLSQRSSTLPRASVHSMLIKIALNHFTVVSALARFGVQGGHMLPSEAVQVLREYFSWDGGVVTADFTWECLLKEDLNMTGAQAMLIKRAAWIAFPLLWLAVATLCWGLWKVLPSLFSKPWRGGPTTPQDEARSPMRRDDPSARDTRAEPEGFHSWRCGLSRRSSSTNSLESEVRGEPEWWRHFLCPQLWIVCLTFIHPTVTRQLLEILPCRTFPTIPWWEPPGKLLEKPYPTVRLSLLDTSIECYKREHLVYTIVAVVGLCVWSFGPVIAALSILCSYKQSGRLYKRQTRRMFGFLYNGYRRSYYFYDAVFALRRIATLVIAQVGASLGNGMIQLVCWQLIAGLSLFLQLKIKPFDSRTFDLLNRMEAQGLLIWNISLWCLMLLSSTSGHPLVEDDPGFQKGLGYAVTALIVIMNSFHIITLIFHTIHHSLEVLMTSILLMKSNTDSALGPLRKMAFGIAASTDRRRAKLPLVRLSTERGELTLIMRTKEPSGPPSNGRMRTLTTDSWALRAASLPLPATISSAPPRIYRPRASTDSTQAVQETRSERDDDESVPCSPVTAQKVPQREHTAMLRQCWTTVPSADQSTASSSRRAATIHGPTHMPVQSPTPRKASRGDQGWPEDPQADDKGTDPADSGRASTPESGPSSQSRGAQASQASQSRATEGASPSSDATSGQRARTFWRRVTATLSLSLTARLESDQRKMCCSEIMTLTSEAMQEIIEQLGMQNIPTDVVEFLWRSTFEVYKARKRSIHDPTTGVARTVLLPSLELKGGTSSPVRRGGSFHHSSTSSIDILSSGEDDTAGFDDSQEVPLTDFQSSMAFVVDRLINAGSGWRDMYRVFRDKKDRASRKGL
ncbi:unnamed protein product [Vitrella brassicaformis CCMP3155]|uniref:Uncharacterized protein n=2 Tax=Vitrella brassicaformis TaxID=1169539 RepID=A0A0G4EPD2_VITBC|nr:unnamed protein product [Vitrella brassicaformis CCMP3155]|eukprot:CEL99311.1 unnamed protein product [Vitrella brassicaformis CCMP3155]